MGSARSTPAPALGALRRLEQLIQEAVITVPRALIAETINLIAVLAGRGTERRLDRARQRRRARVRPAITSSRRPSDLTANGDRA